MPRKKSEKKNSQGKNRCEWLLEKKENRESSGADPDERSPKKTKKKEGPKNQKKRWSIQKHTGLEEEAQESSKTQKK